MLVLWLFGFLLPVNFPLYGSISAVAAKYSLPGITGFHRFPLPRYAFTDSGLSPFRSAEAKSLPPAINNANIVDR